MDINDFLEIGEIQSKTKNFKRKYENAVAVAEQQLQLHKYPYVALSGGKDSIAMAYIVNVAAERANKDFRFWTHLSDASFPGTRETVLEVSKKLKREIDIYDSPVSAFEMIQTKQKTIFGKQGCFYSSIRQYAKDKDLAFVGVRAAESRRRTRAAKIHGMCFHSESMGNVDTCYPLLYFRLEDVAAVMYMHNTPIHPIYKKMCINENRNCNDEAIWIRLNYVTSRDLLNKGTAVFLKLNYPDIFEKLKQYYPEIAAYV